MTEISPAIALLLCLAIIIVMSYGACVWDHRRWCKFQKTNTTALIREEISHGIKNDIMTVREVKGMPGVGMSIQAIDKDCFDDKGNYIGSKEREDE